MRERRHPCDRDRHQSIILFPFNTVSVASCHWGTWGTCPPPDGVATLVNSLQNRVKSITMCVISNANNGK